MHTDAVAASTVLLVDDLLATGGTMQACVRMRKAGATIAGIAFAIELDGLNGRQRLAPYECFSLIQYDNED